MTHNAELRPKKPEELAGDEIRRLRKERNWSQEELARRMSVYGYDWHQTTVGRTESAERPLRLNEVVHLAALFNVPVTQFLLPVDMTLQEIDKEIKRAVSELDHIESRRPALTEAVTAAREGLNNRLGAYRLWDESRERVRAHLQMMRALREILGQGQGEPV